MIGILAKKLFSHKKRLCIYPSIYKSIKKKTLEKYNLWSLFSEFYGVAVVANKTIVNLLKDTKWRIKNLACPNRKTNF